VVFFTAVNIRKCRTRSLFTYVVEDVRSDQISAKNSKSFACLADGLHCHLILQQTHTRGGGVTQDPRNQEQVFGKPTIGSQVRRSPPCRRAFPGRDPSRPRR